MRLVSSWGGLLALTTELKTVREFHPLNESLGNNRLNYQLCPFFLGHYSGSLQSLIGGAEALTLTLPALRY